MAAHDPTGDRPARRGLLGRVTHRVARPVWAPLRARLDAQVDARVDHRLGPYGHRLHELAGDHARLEREVRGGRRAVFTPPITAGDADAPFMAGANCQIGDFTHPRYLDLISRLAMAPQYHRKQWEWVFLLHHLERVGALQPGARALGFGVGTEPLPAYFASLGIRVTATDAPAADAVWTETAQHSKDVADLFHPGIVDDRVVREMVTTRPCDMRAIDPELTGFDFNWSSCCFEHLGSLDAGLDFVVQAVEQTLRPGGWSVHTTEFNLSSNDQTLTDGITVLYRTVDMDRLQARLAERGHHMEPFVIAAPAHPLDYHVDVPPYTHEPHTKLWLDGYVATSVGIVVQRGAA